MDDAQKQQLSLGRTHFERGQYAEAEKCLAALLAHNPPYADLHWMLGVCCYHLGQLNRAQTALESALKLNPAYTEAALNLAVVYNDLSKYAEAREIYERTLSRQRATSGRLDGFVRGKLANRYAEIGHVYASAGMWEEAMAEYRRALKLGPQFVDIRLKLAEACQELGMLEEALQEYQEIARQKPDYISAQLRYGMALHAAGRTPDARKVWDEVLKKDPSNKSAQLYLKILHDAEAVPAALRG